MRSRPRRDWISNVTPEPEDGAILSGREDVHGEAQEAHPETRPEDPPV